MLSFIIDVHGVASGNTARFVKALSLSLSDYQQKFGLPEDYITGLKDKIVKEYFSVHGEDNEGTTAENQTYSNLDIITQNCGITSREERELIATGLLNYRRGLYVPNPDIKDLITFCRGNNIPYTFFTNGDENQVYRALQILGFSSEGEFPELAFAGKSTLVSENWGSAKGRDLNFTKPSGLIVSKIKDFFGAYYNVDPSTLTTLVIGDTYDDITLAKNDRAVPVSLVKSSRYIKHAISNPDPEVLYLLSLKEIPILATFCKADLTLEKELLHRFTRQVTGEFSWQVNFLESNGSTKSLYEVVFNPNLPGPENAILLPRSKEASESLWEVSLHSLAAEGERIHNT